MDVARSAADEQATLWDGVAGRAWVEAQLFDQVLEPFEDLLVAAVSAATGVRVLDVGCGTGSTTLAVARLLGAKGRCIGIDISQPMIAAARGRADSVTIDYLRHRADEHPTVLAAGFERDQNEQQESCAKSQQHENEKIVAIV